MLRLDSVLIEPLYWSAVMSARPKKGGGSCLLQDNETNKQTTRFLLSA